MIRMHPLFTGKNLRQTASKINSTSYKERSKLLRLLHSVEQLGSIPIVEIVLQSKMYKNSAFSCEAFEGHH